MASRDKFITLEKDFIDKFDEIIVVGDIHGCYDEFKELLDKVHSESPSRNPIKCLKILVGDFVNKGPKSIEVLKLCADIYPESVLAVRGNHDEAALREYVLLNKYNICPKRRWIRELSFEYFKYLKLLPYSITIPSLKCIIVHAGLNPSIEEPNKDTPTDMMVSMRNIVVEKDPKTEEPYYRCTREKYEGKAWATFWLGPEHVYFGHDSRRRLQDNHEYATGLDTGCVYGDRLSYTYIKGAKKGQIFSIKAKEEYEASSDIEIVDDRKRTAEEETQTSRKKVRQI